MKTTKDIIQALNDLTKKPMSLDERIQEGLRLGCNYLDMDYGFINRIENGIQTTTYAHGPHDELQVGSSTKLANTYCRKTIKEDDDFLVENALEEGWKDDPAYDQFGLSCYFGGTIVVDGDLYGTACFADSVPRQQSMGEDERTNAGLIVNWLTGLVRQKHDRQALKQQRDFLRDITDQLPGAIFEFRADEEYDFTYMSKGIQEIAGLPRSVFLNDFEAAREAVHPEDREQVFERIARAVESVEAFEADYRYKTGEGIKWVTVRSHPVYSERYNSTVWRGVMVDITKQKEIERALEQANDHKEMLIDEVHHRVKNNLQIISSMLSMQERETDNEKARTALQESSNRIKTMSLIHQRLYQIRNEGGDIDFGDYLNNFVSNLQSFYTDCRINFEQSSIVLLIDPDVLIPLSLILNELVSNACEHGGDALVAVRQTDSGLALTVKDDGEGVTRRAIEEQSGLGWTLVTRLAEHQLNGSVTVEKTNGTAITVNVPL